MEEGETLSSLVRRAVDHEIRDEYIPKDAIDGLEDSHDELDVDLSVVTDRLNEIQKAVDSFEERLDVMSALSEDEEEDLEKLGMDILPRIPSYPQDIPETALRDLEGKGDMDPSEYIGYIIEPTRENEQYETIDGSVKRFAREMRENTPKVRAALINLERNTTENVESGVVNGTRHWMCGL